VARSRGQRGAPNANVLPTNLILMKGLSVLGCPTVLATVQDPSIRAPRLAQVLRWAADKLVDRLGPEVLHWVVQGLGSGLTVVNRVVDGVCGLIPEIGAGICTVVVSGVLRLGYDLVASEVVRELALLGVKKLMGLAIDKLAEALAPRVSAIV
jgi:hypothetical protein